MLGLGFLALDLALWYALEDPLKGSPKGLLLRWEEVPFRRAFPYLPGCGEDRAGYNRTE